MQVKVRGKDYEVCIPSACPFATARFGDKEMIVGIKPWVEYTPELYQEFQDAWAGVVVKHIRKSWNILSASRPGHEHRVTRVNDTYFCDCPAMSECWHIKLVKRWEEEGREF